MRKQNTRKSKQENGEGRVIKDKFLQDRIGSINSSPLKPLNPAQKQYMEYINTKPLVIATGYPGTSKTYIPTVMACDKYVLGEIDKIYLVRPAVSDSKSVGYFAGDKNDKCSIWLGEILSVLRDRLDRGTLEIALKTDDIELLPLEAIKGRTLKRCFVIIDEAEDITKTEARKLVTRVGEDCTMVFCGDIGQSDLKTESGLRVLKEMVERCPQLERTVGLVDFNRPSDIVRSEVCKLWTMAFVTEGVGDY